MPSVFLNDFKAHNTVFEIARVRLSETSDYLLGQVNNPLAVIRRTSGNLQQYLICQYHFIIMQSWGQDYKEKHKLDSKQISDSPC